MFLKAIWSNFIKPWESVSTGNLSTQTLQVIKIFQNPNRALYNWIIWGYSVYYLMIVKFESRLSSKNEWREIQNTFGECLQWHSFSKSNKDYYSYIVRCRNTIVKLLYEVLLTFSKPSDSNIIYLFYTLLICSVSSCICNVA